MTDLYHASRITYQRALFLLGGFFLRASLEVLLLALPTLDQTLVSQSHSMSHLPSSDSLDHILLQCHAKLQVAHSDTGLSRRLNLKQAIRAGRRGGEANATTRRCRTRRRPYAVQDRTRQEVGAMRASVRMFCGQA